MPPTTSPSKGNVSGTTVTNSLPAMTDVSNHESQQPHDTSSEVIGPMAENASEDPGQSLPPPPPWLAAYLAIIEQFALLTPLPPGFVAALVDVGNQQVPPDQKLLFDEIAAYLANAGYPVPSAYTVQSDPNNDLTVSSPEMIAMHMLSLAYMSAASSSTAQSSTSSSTAQSTASQILLAATNAELQFQNDIDGNGNLEGFVAPLPYGGPPSPLMSSLTDSDTGGAILISGLVQSPSVYHPVVVLGGLSASSSNGGSPGSFLAALSAVVEPASPWPNWPSPMTVLPPPGSLPISSWLRNLVAPLDAVTFVNTLEHVDISTVAADDMKCPHCWLPFGTTDDDDPFYTYSPDPEEDPEVSAHMLAFRDLPHCEKANNDPVKTPCGHLFGKGCLIEILEKMDPFCPVCKHDLRKKA